MDARAHLTRVTVSLFVLAAACAPSTPAQTTEDSATPPETATPTPEETATPVETTTPSATAAPAETATSKMPSTQAGAANCPELPKKKCQITRGCVWNDVHKCQKEETQ